MCALCCVPRRSPAARRRSPSSWKVTPSHLSLWIGGIEPCPSHIFLKAVDLVLEGDLAEHSRAP